MGRPRHPNAGRRAGPPGQAFEIVFDRVVDEDVEQRAIGSTPRFDELASIIEDHDSEIQNAKFLDLDRIGPKSVEIENTVRPEKRSQTAAKTDLVFKMRAARHSSAHAFDGVPVGLGLPNGALHREPASITTASQRALRGLRRRRDR
ncbi:MAG: hypothetical protein IBJ15_00245 [Alphaproteobacteria bacterium]|nr:hypothetical protein [Alphaproteobacteria bacterium]